jgi:predicted MFS family arabinose efflux permease
MMTEMTKSPKGVSDIFSGRTFLLMWLAMLISTMGTFVLLLALSSKIFMATRSSAEASLVFLAQWIAPITTFFVVGKLANEGFTKRRLIVSDLAAAAVSLIIGTIWESSPPALFTLLFFRGFLETLTKVLRDTALKRLTPEDQLERSSSVFNTSYFIGIALGSLISAILTARTSLFNIAVIDGLSFVVSAVLYYFAFDSQQAQRQVFSRSLRLLSALQTIYGRPILFLNLLLLLVSIGVFQGFHNIARSALPIGLLGLPESGLQITQLIFTVGVTLGAFFVSRYYQRDSGLKIQPRTFIFLSALVMTTSCITRHVVSSFFFYFLYAFFFEVCFTKFKNELMLRTPKEEIGQVMAVVQVGSTAILASSILGFGWLADMFGLLPVAAAMATICIAATYSLSQKLETLAI